VILYAVTLILLVLSGSSLVARLGGVRNRIEWLGLSILFGGGLVTASVMLAHLAGAPIRPWVYLPVLGLFALDGARLLRRAVKGRAPSLGVLLRPRHPVVAAATWIVLAVVLTVIWSRILLLPNRFYDSLTSFDLFARAVAAEGRFRVSLFDYMTIRGAVYTPHATTTFAWGYQCGLPDAALAMALPAAGFTLWLFGFARRFFGATTSYGLLALAFTSPDFNSFTFYPLTNGFVTMYAAVALLYAFAAARGSTMGNAADGEEPSTPAETRAATRIAWVASIFAVWSRAEALVFVLAVSLVLFVSGRRADSRTKRWLPFAILGSAMGLVAAWNAYTGHVLEASGAERVILRPFWDAERVRVLIMGAPMVASWVPSMGLATWASLASVVFLVVQRWRAARGPRGTEERTGQGTIAWYWGALGVALASYALLFYQADPAAQDSLESLLRSSFRRGVTAFVVPMWFGVLVSPLGVRVRRELGCRFGPLEVGRQH